MTINMEIASVFKRYTGNQSKIDVSGKNIGEVLQDMARQYPETRKVFLDEEGRLLRSYDIFINGKSVYPLKPETPVKEGDKLDLVMIINGG